MKNENNKYVAIKNLKLDKLDNSKNGTPLLAFREITILKILNRVTVDENDKKRKARNIVKFRGVITNEKPNPESELSIVFDYISF